VQSPVTYWFDDARINAALSDAAAADLKAHVRAAANDWATRTGITFTEVATGTGKVRIYASGVGIVPDANGLVDSDPTFAGVVRIQFSSEWPEWNTAGERAHHVPRVGTCLRIRRRYRERLFVG
jgi:hypothetical protein